MRAAAGRRGYDTGAWTAQRSRPPGPMSSIHEPVISLTSVPPSERGRAVHGAEERGGSCRQIPVVPYWRTTRCDLR